MSFETIRLEVREGVAHLTLDRERNANAINLQMARELMRATLRCDEDPEVRAVLLTGRGRMFCAGGDIGSFSEAADGMPALIKEITTYLHAALSRLARMRAPMVAAVHGPAAGAGFSLVCAADLALASEAAKFTMAYTRVGLTPDGSATYFLPRLVGARRALELMLTNRTLSAAEALEWGIVNRVVPADALAKQAEELAGSLAEGPTNAFGGVKRLLIDGANETLETQMERETRAICDAARSADAEEGVAAFLAKRPPRFRGT